MTTGFRSDEVFRIEDTSCSLSEIMVYLVDMQKSYETRYGEGIWLQGSAERSVEEGVKEASLARISQVKTMNLLARERGIALSEKQEALSERAASMYVERLSDDELKQMGALNADTVTRMYAEYALANKLYRYIIRDINPEISDDEARTITVEQIFLRTLTEDETIYNEAKRIRLRALSGESFTELIDAYSNSAERTVSFGKGEKDPAYESAAFNLGTGEISDVIRTDEGYYILKCLTTFNREQTDANKLKIVEARKREVFAQEYDAFADALTRELNEPLWETVALPAHNADSDADFFGIYAEVFAGAIEY